MRETCPTCGHPIDEDGDCRCESKLPYNPDGSIRKEARDVTELADEIFTNKKDKK